MSLDITTYLLNQGISSISELNAAASSENTAQTEETSTDFADTLSDEISKLTQSGEENTDLSEMEDLIDSLDRSILGSVVSESNKKEFAQDILNDPSASQDVINELVGGQLSAIVTAGSDDDENAEDSLAESASEITGTDTDTETLAQNLETIMESIGNVSAQ